MHHGSIRLLLLVILLIVLLVLLLLKVVVLCIGLLLGFCQGRSRHGRLGGQWCCIYIIWS